MAGTGTGKRVSVTPVAGVTSPPAGAMSIGGDGGIIDLARKAILDDDIEPYLWSGIELIHYLNIITEELYRETLLIEDRTTTALTQLKLLSNLSDYTIDDRVLNVKEGAKLSENTNDNYGVLKRTSQAYMDQLKATWREITDIAPTRFIPDCGRGSLSIYPKFDDEGEVVGASNITFTAATKKISKVGEDFTAHYVVGDEINVSGTTYNDGYVTATLVSATEITVTETLVNETLTSATLRKVRDTLLMVVNRLPLTPFVVADITAVTAVYPEIKTMYHRELLYGIGREAFQKEDTQTLDLAAADRNGKRFEEFKDKVKRSLVFLNRSERQGSSGSSGIWKSY